MAAYVLGVLGAPQTASVRAQHAAPLRALLNDPVADVRWNAALSLARLGDASAVETLLKMLERDALVSQYAIKEENIEQIMINASKGLALVGDKESVKILESISKNDKSLKVRQAAMDAMRFLAERVGS